MGKTGRPRHPDILTAREWEVLALVRERLTNEEIARRLGITLDGAKYHVSQILSKLGVATREAAAAWQPEQRRAWWAHWALWAKVAGAATVAATAGIAVLSWGTILPGPSEEIPHTIQDDEGSQAPDGSLGLISWQEALDLLRDCQVSKAFEGHRGGIVWLTDGTELRMAPEPGSSLFVEAMRAEEFCGPIETLIE